MCAFFVHFIFPTFESNVLVYSGTNFLKKAAYRVRAMQNFNIMSGKYNVNKKCIKTKTASVKKVKKQYVFLIFIFD